MTREELNQFFNERPALSKRAIAKECGVSLTLLNWILTGERTLTSEVANRLLPVVRKYGYIS